MNQRRSKLHPHPETRPQLEKLGFQVFSTNKAIEDICSESGTCYGFATSALYRLPVLVGATTICLKSGADERRAMEDILKKMGVPFR